MNHVGLGRGLDLLLRNPSPTFTRIDSGKGSESDKKIST